MRTHVLAVIEEWWEATKQDVHDNPNAPEIHLGTIALPHKYFRCHVNRRAAGRLQYRILISDNLGEAKVAYGPSAYCRCEHGSNTKLYVSDIFRALEQDI